MQTTLNAIRKCSPCISGWNTLLKSLNKTKADDEPLELSYILQSNGLDDAIWCLKAVDGKDKEIRLFAVWCARQVQHLMKDPRSIAALDIAEKFALGLTSEEALRDAAAASYADAAAYAYADAAAYAAAYAADAAYYTAAAYAASAAADAAYYTAAVSAVSAASAAADAASAAADAADANAAYTSSREKQAKEFLRMCKGTKVQSTK